MELSILNTPHMLICGDALFVGEEDNGTTHNVYIPVDSLKSYLQTDIDIELGTDLMDAAQGIYDASISRPTSYDLEIIKQKHTGYLLERKNGTFHSLCKSGIPNIKEFMSRNNYKTYTLIFG